MSEPLCGSSICVNASVLPSGDHDSGLCMLRYRSAAPGAALQSAGIHHIVMVPVFHERKVSRRPSASTRASDSLRRSSFSSAHRPRAKSYMKMSCDAPSTSMASLAAVRRKPRVEVRRAAWQRQRRTCGRSCRPRRERACRVPPGPRRIRDGPPTEMRKRRHARVRAHEEAVGDGEWLSGDFELLRIKRHGQKRSGSRVDQVA